MGDFLDFIVFIAILVVLLLMGGFVYLLGTNPLIAYGLLFGGLLGIAVWIGAWGWKRYRKQHLGPYYETFSALLQAKKDVMQSMQKLDPHLRQSLKRHTPRIKLLHREAQHCLLKLAEIDEMLSAFEAKQQLPTSFGQKGGTAEMDRKLRESNERYSRNIEAIQASKRQYSQQVQQVLHFLQELNSQMTALRYSHKKQEIEQDIAATIDDLLIDIQALDDIDYS